MDKELIVDFSHKGIESAIVLAPYDEGLRILEAENYKEISLIENAWIRTIKKPEFRDGTVFYEGNRVFENCLYLPRKGVFLTRYNFPKDFPEKITEYHRKGDEFYLDEENGFDKKKLEAILKYHSVKIKRRNFEISLGDMNSDKITLFAFGKNAKNYGMLLEKEKDIECLPFWIETSIGNRPFVRKVWFSSMGNSSRLLCNYRGLELPYYIRGIKHTH